MGLRINNNVEAFNAHRQLAKTSDALGRSMEKLSSGFRINRAADDAAGLGISEKMRAQIGGVAMAQRNAQDGISLVQTAEGALQEVTSILQRIRDLAVQYSNGTNDPNAKIAITAEVTQLSSEISRMISQSSFNGIQLLQGSGVMATLQVGANDNETITVAAADANTTIGTVIQDFINGVANPNLMASLDGIIGGISDLRAGFGAVQNRLEHTVNALAIYQENLQSAESRIRDVDMASEMTNFTRLQILQQSGTAMLAQANLAPQGVLALLK